MSRPANVRGRHRRRHFRSRAAGARDRRCARRQRARTATIHYIGAQRGIETRLLPPSAVPAHVPRRRRPPAPADRVEPRLPLKMLRSAPSRDAVAARACGRRVVVSSVATPACRPRSPRVASGPVVVVSYDRLPGRASRFAARCAAACARGVRGLSLPRATLTGRPVRRAVLDVDRDGPGAARAAARHSCGSLRGRRVRRIAGFGVLNDAVAEHGRLELRRPRRSPSATSSVTASSTDDAATRRRGGMMYQRSATRTGCRRLRGGRPDDRRGGASTVHELAATGIAGDHRAVGGRRPRTTRPTTCAWLADVGGAVLISGADVQRSG